MDNLHRTKLLFLILVLVLIVQSCAGKKSVIPSKSSAPSTAHAKQHMTAGAYQKAIDAYNVEYRRHSQDQDLVKEYVKSLEDIKSSADKASDREDFKSAGRKYHVLLKQLSPLQRF